MYVLGFDYGHKNIGVAIGQEISRTASPLVTLQRKDGPPWNAIEELIKQWQPRAIVIGLPLTAEGEEQPVTLAARQFSKTLENKFKKKYSLNFFFHDERYTSQAAESLYSKNQDDSSTYGHRKPKKRRKQQDWNRDAVAAVLILEAWLEISHC